MAGNNQSSEPKKGWDYTNKATTEPWKPAQPGLEHGLSELRRHYDTGVGTQLPSFSSVLGMGQGTQGAISSLRDLAANPSALTQQSQQAVGGLLAGDPRYQDIYNRSLTPSAGQQYLEGIVSSDQPNPYLQGLLDIGSENITNRVNSLQSAKGRYGGLGAGGHVDALSRGISEFQTPILYQAYNDRTNAAGLLDSMRRGDMGLGLSAVGGDVGTRLGAAGTARGLESDRLGLMDRLMTAGLTEDQYAQKQREEEYNRKLWELGGAQQASLANYLSGVGGIAGLGGTKTEIEPRRPGQKFLGGLSTVAGLLGSFI